MYVWNVVIVVISSNTGYLAFIQHYLNFTHSYYTYMYVEDEHFIIMTDLTDVIYYYILHSTLFKL